VKSSRDIIQLSRAVEITVRPKVQWLIERNVKCHVTFFRLIKFKIYIRVCNNELFDNIGEVQLAMVEYIKFAFSEKINL